MNWEQIVSKLKPLMKKYRYQHSLRVSVIAGKIAQYYHLPVEKAKISGLIHDCVKDYSLDELKSLINKYQISLTKVEKNIPKIWHAFVGAEMAKDIFQIDDLEILNAIRYHSTASSNMSLLGKIVYIADKIEPGRKSESMKKLWKIIWEDIDLVMLELLNEELKYLVSEHLVIHPATIEVRNKIIIDRRVTDYGKSSKA